MDNSTEHDTSSEYRGWPVLLTDISLVILVIVTRIFSVSRYLHKWDSVQFALALSDYDIHSHQPHPTGYPAYVGLAWIFKLFTGDDNLALVGVGVFSAILLAIALNRIASRLWGWRAGLFAGLLGVINPLTWYYSSIALSYMPGVTVATLAAWLALTAKGKWKFLIPVAGGIAGLFWLPAGILVFPVCLWGFLRHSMSESDDDDWLSSRSNLSVIFNFVVIYAIPFVAGYAPVIADTGGLAPYMDEVRSESGKHVLRFGEWASRPMAEFLATTGALNDFMIRGIGMGRWLLLILLVPVTGEKGCEPVKVGFLVPFGIAGFIFMHWITDPLFRITGIFIFLFAAYNILPAPEKPSDLVPRRFLFWWIIPGLILFTLVYVNYIGIFLFFIPPLILAIAWSIERAGLFMSLQTIKDTTSPGYKPETDDNQKNGELPAPDEVKIIKGPDRRVELVIAWVLFGLTAMNYLGVFIDSRTESQESLLGIMARDVWLESVLEAVDEIPVDRDEMIVLGGVDDYRHWTYYVPEAKVIWTKYILYEDPKPGRGIWVSEGRRQEKAEPEVVTDVNGSPGPAAVFDADGKSVVVFFPDELELFDGREEPVGVFAGEDPEPILYYVRIPEGSDLYFSEGEWGIIMDPGSE